MILVRTSIIEVDFRKKPVGNKQSQGFMCSFGPNRCLLGYKSNLWILTPLPTFRFCQWPWTETNTGHSLILKFDIHCDDHSTLSLEGTLFEKVDNYRNFLDFCNIKSVGCQLSLLQRWFTSINQRRQAKRLALAMAMHARLGQNSLLQSLDVDLLTQIARLG